MDLYSMTSHKPSLLNCSCEIRYDNGLVKSLGQNHWTRQIDRLVQEKRNSSVLTMELRLFCSNPTEIVFCEQLRAVMARKMSNRPAMLSLLFSLLWDWTSYGKNSRVIGSLRWSPYNVTVWFQYVRYPFWLVEFNTAFSCGILVGN